MYVLCVYMCVCVCVSCRVAYICVCAVGKTHVINCLLVFERAWGSFNRIVVSASSGLAAALLGGNTVHGQLGIGFTTSQPHYTTSSFSLPCSAVAFYPILSFFRQVYDAFLY